MTFSRLRNAVFLIGLALSAGGCLTAGEYVPIERYALYSTTEEVRANPSGKAVGVRSLDYVSFYREKMVYRDDGFAVAYEDYHQWAELPRDAATRMLIDALAATGAFREVGYAFDMPRPDYVVTGQVRRFEQVRTTEPWTALCEARIELRERETGVIVWGETLTVDAPHESPDAPGFAAAMNAALTKLTQNAAERIAENVSDS